MSVSITNIGEFYFYLENDRAVQKQ